MIGNFEKHRLLDKLDDHGYLEIEGSVSADMTTLLQQHKICEARKLKVGASLPSSPVKMMQSEAERRLECLRQLPSARVTLLKFKIEAAAFQNWLHQGKLKPVKNLAGVWFGWISIDPAHVSVLEISPFGPKHVCMWVCMNVCMDVLRVSISALILQLFYNMYIYIYICRLQVCMYVGSICTVSTKKWCMLPTLVNQYFC